MPEVWICLEWREVNIDGVGTNRNFKTFYQSPDLPSPTVMTGPQKTGGGGWISISERGSELNTKEDSKPPYKIPSMQEINAIPLNGFKVASTFSGCGGSCLGYRMAGFKVVWANEFVPIAQESYKANAAPDCFLDPRDIKNIKPEEVLKQTGLKIGELDLFDGSPPCQAFSTAGKREKGWGKDKSYEHGAKQKNETLFDEYIRLLRGLQPKVFVAENVSGLVKGTAKGYFLDILKELKASGYNVKAKLLDAQWLGVPQTRQRIIFVGVRNDLLLDPVFPSPLKYNYSVRDALPHIQKAMVRDGFKETKPTIDMISAPAACGNASGGSAYSSHFVEPSILMNNLHENGGFKSTECTDAPAPTITATQCRMMLESEIEIQSGALPKKYSSSKRSSPAIVAGRTTEIRQGVERRKFTIDEVKRICSFPDDFVLKGSYAQQWERLGNSVPPVMMFHIASTIRDNILRQTL